MVAEAATMGAGAGGAAAATKDPASSSQAKVARAGGPASTSYKVIDESSVTVPSKLPARNPSMAPPSGSEVAEAARRLDIDLVFDADLLYIAEELLMSPVPDGWEAHEAGRLPTKSLTPFPFFLL